MTLLKELFALSELKNDMNETEYTTWDSWRKACRKAYPEVTFEGDRDIAQAMYKKGRAVGEWDGSVGVVYKKPAGLNEDECPASTKEAFDLGYKNSAKGKQKAIFDMCPHSKGTPENKAYWEGVAKYAKDHPESVKEGFAIKINGELWMKGDKPVMFASQEEANAAILKSPSMSEKNAKVVSLNEAKTSFQVGDKVKKTMGVKLNGVVIKDFNSKDQDDGGYSAPKKGDVPVKWSDGTKGYIASRFLSLNESPELQALGKSMKGTVGTKSTMTQSAADAEVDAKVKTDVNTPPAEKAASDAADDETSTSEFKVGDKVMPNAGPHKDQTHSVIHVFPDGRVNLTPDGLKPDQIKYRQGAITARADQVTLAEGLKYEDPKGFGRKLFNKAMGIPSGPYKYKIGDTVKYRMEPDQKDGSGEGKISKLLNGHHYLVNGKPVNQNEIKMLVKESSLLSQFSLHEAGARKDGFMPINYGPHKGHKIEAYGRKGMKNTMWRKMFKNTEECEKWCQDNDATVEGLRNLDDNEKVNESFFGKKKPAGPKYKIGHWAEYKIGDSARRYEGEIKKVSDEGYMIGNKLVAEKDITNTWLTPPSDSNTNSVTHGQLAYKEFKRDTGR